MPSLNPRTAARRAVRAFVDRLRCLRQRQGVTLTALAQRTGLDVAALCRLEHGSPRNPTVETLGRWAAGLGQELRLELAPTDAGRVSGCGRGP